MFESCSPDSEAGIQVFLEGAKAGKNLTPKNGSQKQGARNQAFLKGAGVGAGKRYI